MKKKQPTKEEIIEDIKRVATKLKLPKLSTAKYLSLGKYSSFEIYRIFTSWNVAKEKAGLIIQKRTLKGERVNTTEDEIIEDVKRVSTLLGEERLTKPMYLSKGNYTIYTLNKFFANWAEVITKAGLIARKVTEEQFIADLIAVANKLGGTNLLKKNYLEYGQYDISRINKKYGSWKNLVSIAGLQCNRKIPEIKLLIDLQRVAKDLKQNRVSMPQYIKYGKYNIAVFTRTFGSWNNANVKAGFRAYIYLTEEEMLDDLRNVAKNISPKPLSYTIYNLKGKYNISNIRYKFGTLYKALKKAGLPVKRKVHSVSNKMADELLLNDMKKAAQQSGKPYLSLTSYDKYGTYSDSTIYKRFGSWNKALKKAGISSWKKGSQITNIEILDDLKRVALLSDKKNLKTEYYSVQGKYSLGTVSLRFGTWNKALKKAGLQIYKK